MCLRTWYVSHVNSTFLWFSNAKRSETDSSVCKGSSHAIGNNCLICLMETLLCGTMHCIRRIPSCNVDSGWVIIRLAWTTSRELLGVEAHTSAKCGILDVFSGFSGTWWTPFKRWLSHYPCRSSTLYDGQVLLTTSVHSRRPLHEWLTKLTSYSAFSQSGLPHTLSHCINWFWSFIFTTITVSLWTSWSNPCRYVCYLSFSIGICI